MPTLESAAFLRRLILAVVLFATPFVGLVSFERAALAQAPAPRVVDTQAAGKGESAEIAMRVAIIDAVRRVNGTAMAFDATKRQQFEDSIRDLEAALSSSDITVSRIAQEIQALSKGLVERVRVLDQRTLPDGSFDATILVGVTLFEPRIASRKTIAVASFRVASPNFGFSGSSVPGNDLARRLTDAINERLVQAAVLTVLDRHHVEEIGREKNFVEAFGRTPDELRRFGKALGADYLLVGSIEAAGLEVINQTVEASGYSFTRSFAGIDVSSRLVEVETGAIRWAETVRVSLGNGDLNRMFPGSVPDPSGTASHLVGQAAEQIVAAVVEAIAPIKVALVDGDTVWLNRGTGRLTPGMRLQVRGGGQEVIDPDTGEHLGQAERTVAVVEVVVTDSRKSQCRLVEGRTEDLRSGQIARPLARP